MPGRNQTGPQGQGPRTGRGMGNCSSDSRTEAQGRPFFGGFGLGRGGKTRGGGRGQYFGGRRNNSQYYREEMSPEDEVSMLESRMTEINDRINVLKNQK